MEQTLTILAGMVVLVGLMGTVVPGLPGLPLMWLGFLLQSWLTNFTSPSPTMLVVFGIVIGLFYLLQVLTAPLATKAFGGTKWGAVGAFVGLLLAIPFSLSMVSLFLFPLIGAILGELGNGQTRHQAFKSGLGAVLGLLLGTVIEFALGLTFTAIFLVQLLS